MNPAFITALLQLLAAAPSIINDIETTVNQAWGKDHVVQAQKGLTALNQIFADAAPVVTQVQQDFAASTTPTPGKAGTTP